jgi:hypothetical protein
MFASIHMLVIPLTRLTLSCDWGAPPYFDWRTNMLVMARYAAIGLAVIVIGEAIRRSPLPLRVGRFVQRTIVAGLGLVALAFFAIQSMVTEAGGQVLWQLGIRDRPLQAATDCFAPWSVGDVAVAFGGMAVVWLAVAALSEHRGSRSQAVADP